MKRITSAALAAAILLLSAACTSGDGSAPGPSTPSTTPGAPSPSPVLPTAPAPVVSPTPASGPPPPATSSPTATPTPPGSDRMIVEAPIDNLAVRVAASAPPQYFLDVTSGLPSGCASFYRVDVSRAGTVITVKVLNTMPRAAQACTMIYGFKDHNIALGSNFTAGTTYTVHVNDRQTSFTAQ